MRISELTAKYLRTLHTVDSAKMAVELAQGGAALPGANAGLCRTIEHRGLEYTVGHWRWWEGEFWVVECRTGMIFRGSLAYVKDMIRLCSACVYEPNEVR